MTTSETTTIAGSEGEEEELCAFAFPSSQGKNYRKTEFVLHSRVAEIVANQLGLVFYDDGDGDDGGNGHWSITPLQLRDMVLANILQGDDYDDGNNDYSSSFSRYPIYGSAIAFEPGVWTIEDGLDEGVTHLAASEACLDDVVYCTEEAALWYEELQLRTLGRYGGDGLTMYSPYAFRGPPDENVYENCSYEQRKFCPSMDLARAYNYANITLDGNEWYTAPRCLYLRDGIRSGYWTSPYFDSDAGEINMVTYSHPIVSAMGKFLGIATIDISVDALCYGDQCDAVDYNYLTSIRPVGFTFVLIATMCSVGCAMWTQAYRKNRVVIASQPFFLRLICLGCLVMVMSIVPLSIDDAIASPEGCSHACMAVPWLLSIGFTTTFSALFSKIWRLNKVYRNARNMPHQKVKEKDVLFPFAVLMTANCILMLAWNLTDPLVWVRTEPNDDYESYGQCRAEGNAYIVFLTLIAIVNFYALVLANVQAFRARHVSTEFSESLYVMMTMVSLLQALLIGIPLLIISNDNTVARYFVASGIIFVSTMTILGLMFGPKIYKVRRSEKELRSEQESQPTLEQDPGSQIEIIMSRTIKEPGNHTVMTGTF